EGKWNDQSVPAVELDLPAGNIAHRNDRGARGLGQMKHSGFRCVARPARPVWREDEILAAAVGINELEKPPQPSACRRPAYRADAPACQGARENLAVVRLAVHDADRLTARLQGHHHGAIVPKGEDHLLTAPPALEKIVAVQEARTHRPGEELQEGA